MSIKVGSIVCHSGALQWGVGKVLEITPSLAIIQFSDGKNRKIAVSHFNRLEPAAAASFLPPHDSPAEAKHARALRAPIKRKAAVTAD